MKIIVGLMIISFSCVYLRNWNVIRVTRNCGDGKGDITEKVKKFKHNVHRIFCLFVFCYAIKYFSHW